MLSTIAAAAQPEEIAPFRLTGLEGSLDLRYLGDYYTQDTEGGSNSDRDSTSFQQRLYVLLHSYIYHPNFIRLDVGGGPVLFQNKFEDNQDRFTHNDMEFDFDATMNILEKKPYPARLYYDRRHSIPAPASREPIAVRNTRYGANLAVRQPLIPGSLGFHASRFRAEGSGALRVVDEKIDRAGFTARGDLGPQGKGSLTYTWSKQQSASGSRDLPIDPTRITTNEVRASTDHRFGADEQFRLFNRLTWEDWDFDDARSTPSRELIHYFPELRWRHSETFRTWYRYDYIDRNQEVVDSTFHRAIAGLSHQGFDDRLTTDGDVHARFNRTTGLDEDVYGTRMSLRWLQPFNRVTLGLTGAWGYDYSDRKASSDTIEVIGERHVLAGTVAVSLNNAFVVRDTIVVSNSTRTQVFVEDLDYRVIVISDITQIQRIPAGNIEDGEAVLVDYEYLTGGTFTFTQFFQNYRIDLGLYEYYRLYAGYRDNNLKRRSGIPTVPLNSLRETLVGARMDLPFLENYKVGGLLEARDHDADVGPYDQKTAEAYFEMATAWNGQLRFFAVRRKTNRQESPEDQDLTRYGLRFFSRPWPRTTLSADVIRDKDDGGTVKTENTRAGLRVKWAYRKLTLVLNASHRFTRFGDTDTDRNRIEAILSREF